MKIECRVDPPLQGYEPQPTWYCTRLPFSVVKLSDEFIEVELNPNLTLDQHLQTLSTGLGAKVTKFEGVVKRKLTPLDIEEEMGRLVKYHDWEIGVMQEPKIALNMLDPIMDNMQPSGKLIWNSIFAKRKPVVSLQLWTTTEEADDYVYLPNDCSKSGADVEEFISNAFYTEVMVNAYKKLCAEKSINPEIQLVYGSTLKCTELKPNSGSQHTIPGEIAGRLANSRLINFDDSIYAKDYIRCICDLVPGEYEKEPVRKRVLAKVEHILMGRTSHTYNQRFIHAIYNQFMNSAADVSWSEYRVNISMAVMGILKQMVVESLVLEDNKELFMSRLMGLGYAEYSEAIGEIFDRARE